jgi:hypothetical protein
MELDCGHAVADAGFCARRGLDDHVVQRLERLPFVGGQTLYVLFDGVSLFHGLVLAQGTGHA